MRRRIGALALACGSLLLLGAVAAPRWRGWLLDAMAPDGSFDAATVPHAPDYADPAAWSALPEREGPARATPAGVRALDAAEAPADVFYVHPTTWLGAGWNGPVDDPELNAQTDELATRIQASAFNGCCAVYAPRYRQAHLEAFLHPGADGDAALAIAYADVRAAFHRFLEVTGPARPFLLAGHSQGSLLAARLLREEIAGSALAQRLVAAYLIGAPIPRAPAPGLRGCAAADDVGCVVSWNARGPRYVPGAYELRSEEERLCVDPVRWRADTSPDDAAPGRGAVFLHAGDGRPRPGFADARCRDGTLVVVLHGRPPRDLASRLLDRVMGPENYHPIEYQLFYMDLRENARERVAAWRRRAE